MVLELLPVVSHQYDPLTHPCLRILQTISADCDAVMLCELEGHQLFLLPIWQAAISSARSMLGPASDMELMAQHASLSSTSSGINWYTPSLHQMVDWLVLKDQLKMWILPVWPASPNAKSSHGNRYTASPHMYWLWDCWMQWYCLITERDHAWDMGDTFFLSNQWFSAYSYYFLTTRNTGWWRSTRFWTKSHMILESSSAMIRVTKNGETQWMMQLLQMMWLMRHPAKQKRQDR